VDRLSTAYRAFFLPKYGIGTAVPLALTPQLSRRHMSHSGRRQFAFGFGAAGEVGCLLRVARMVSKMAGDRLVSCELWQHTSVVWTDFSQTPS